jgi:N-acetylmuramoyl-L-alanine amidase
MRNGFPTSMSQLWNQQNFDPYGMNQGGENGGGSDMMQSQNSTAMRNNFTGPFAGGGGGGMSLADMASMFARGGAVDHGAIMDALHIARTHFRRGGPNQVGGYNFHPQFKDETDAMVRGMLAEAGGQGDAGMIAVGHNLNNRAWNGFRGDHDVQSVLTDQNAKGTSGGYSSFLRNNPGDNIAGRNAMNIPESSDQYQHAYQLAQGIKGGQIPDPTNNATHFYNPDTSHPKWGNQLTNTTQIGDHKFGTEPGRAFFDPNGASRMGDQAMSQNMPLNPLQAQAFAGNGQMLPNNMQMPQLQPTSPITPRDMAAPQANLQPPALDNPPLPPMRPQSAPLQSEMGWKPPAEIADKVASLNMAPDIEPPVADAPAIAPASDATSSAGEFSNSMSDAASNSDFGGGLGDIFDSLFNRGGRTHFADGGGDDLNNGALGDAAEFAPAPERRTLEEHYPKPDNGSDLYAIAHDPREEPLKRYGAMGAGMAGDIANGLWDQVKKPGEALRGEYDPSGGRGVGASDEAVQWAANTGLGALGGGTAFHEAPAGSLGMFVGKNAKGIDQGMFEAAQRDLAGSTGPRPYGDLFDQVSVAPKSERQVFDQYKLHPYGTDTNGLPKMWGEISDANATTNYKRFVDDYKARELDDLRRGNPGIPDSMLTKHLSKNLAHRPIVGQLSDFYNHPEFAQRYPDQFNEARVIVDTARGKYLGKDAAGSFGLDKNGKPLIFISRKYAQDPALAASTIGHESQHMVQNAEGLKHLGSSEIKKQVHDTPEWTRWKNAQTDPHYIEFMGNMQHPEVVAGRKHAKHIWENEIEPGIPPDYPIEDYSRAVDTARNRAASQNSAYARHLELEQSLKDRGIKFHEPTRHITGDDAYFAQAIEGQARNTQFRRLWDENLRGKSNPLETIPARWWDTVSQFGFIHPRDLLHKKAGGRVGYATDGAVDGEVSYAPDDQAPPMMAESPDAVKRALSVADQHSTPHEFVQSQLFNPNDEKQLPQYDPEAGARTAKQAALTAYGMTDAGGIQQALGYMPKAEGGYEPSVAEDFKSGNYLASALGAMGAVVPGAGKLSKAARGADAASDATKVAREVAAPTEKAAETFTPAAPMVSNSEVRNAPTVRDMLESNGYFEHPDRAMYSGALDLPAAKGRTWSDLARRTNGSLEEFYKMSELEQDKAFAKAADKLRPYLGKKDGTNAELLSQNGKLAKAQGAGTEFDGLGVENWGVNLSPAMQWDIVNMCGNSASCIKDCLGKVSGGYAQDGALHDAYKWNNARGSGIAKTLALMQEPEAFELALDGNVKARRAIARMNGNHLGVRSNIISDVPGILHDRLRQVNPGVSFYDYTKFGAWRPRSPNQHYTFSSTGISTPQLLGPNGKPIRKEVYNPHSNWLGKNGMRDTLDRGDNVSVVVSQQNHKPTSFLDKETGRRYEAVEGDSHDFRPLDQTPNGQPGKIIVLGRKGNKHTAKNAHKNSNGFIWDYDPATMGDTIEIPDQRPFRRKSGGRIPPRKPLDEELFRNQYANYDHYREAKPLPEEFRNPRRLFGKG